jgi:hypothetical protein
MAPERRVEMAPERRVEMAPERRVVMAPERREACGTQNDNTMPYHNLYNNQAYLVPLMEEEEDVEDDSDEEPEQDDARPVVPFARKMVNSVRGSLYDLQHWDKLTPTLNGENTCGILKYTLTRDTRAPYLLLWVSLLLLLIILICLAVTVGIKKR